MISTLDQVQIRALAASEGRRGFAYFMEMGLGKTLTALADFQRAVDNGDATRMLVICPNSFKSGWLEEIEKHGFAFDVHMYQSGSKSSRDWIHKSFNRPPVLIVNYDAMRKGAGQEDVMRFVTDKMTFGVFDESIQLKGNDSAQTRSAIEVAKSLTWSRVLSGKPTTQGPHDLWAQMRVVKQLNGWNYFAFKTHFCKKGGYKGKAVIGAQHEEYLAELIEPHVFRALKADWTDLPPKIYTIRDYDLSPAQIEQYRQMEEEFVLWLEDGDLVTVEVAISRYMKLAQIQAGFIIKEDKTIQELVPPKSNPRVQLLRQIIDEEVIGKTAIVYHHRYSGEMLKKALADLNPAAITGGLTDEAIASEKSRFNNDPDCRVILLQDQASKYGHTLLGGSEPENRCATTIFFENTYSLDTRSQIEDRNHRRGQTAESVLYVDLVGTKLDRQCVKALQRKEEVYQAVFSLIARATPSQGDGVRPGKRYKFA